MLELPFLKEWEEELSREIEQRVTRAVREQTSQELHDRMIQDDQNLLIRAIRKRFGSLPAEIRVRIRAIRDDTVLRSLLLPTKDCADLAALVQALPKA